MKRPRTSRPTTRLLRASLSGASSTQQCSLLISQAWAAPGRVPGTRELIEHKTRYIVPYRVRGETVEILRVFHTSRRLPERW